MKLLLIEDDADTAVHVQNGLRESGHVVDHAADGPDGQHMALAEQYDCLIVDRMLPGIDGLTIVRKLRETGNATPVLLLSALGDVDDRVEGLRAGGDDYLTKPFAFVELLARLEALQRRRNLEPNATELTVGDLHMNLLTREVRREGVKLNLQPREFKLLEYLMRHSGQVVTRTMLLENVWEYHFDPQTNVIDVHISRLRGKIDKDFQDSYLQTVRGSGYMLCAPE